MENNDQTFNDLCQPFNPEDLEWRIVKAGVSNNNPWALVVCYVTARAIENRLDKVLGKANWEPVFTQIDGGFLCHLKIRVGGEWITKTDGANNTNIEPIKGGISDSLKRAAVQWGIGRYLYQLEETWAKCQIVNTRKEVSGNLHTHKDKKSNQVFLIDWQTPHLPVWALPAVDDRGYPQKIENSENMAALKAIFSEAYKFSEAQNSEALTDIFVAAKDKRKKELEDQLKAKSSANYNQVADWLKGQIEGIDMVPNEASKKKFKASIIDLLGHKCSEFGLNPESFSIILEGK